MTALLPIRRAYPGERALFALPPYDLPPRYGRRCLRAMPRSPPAQRHFVFLVSFDDVHQVMVPNTAPTPAVRAMASAPQKVTRRAPAAMGAPPTRAATAPSIARNTSVAHATAGI